MQRRPLASCVQLGRASIPLELWAKLANRIAVFVVIASGFEFEIERLTFSSPRASRLQRPGKSVRIGIVSDK
jgi:hypothetical protein